jgi:hypothetical protein
MKKRIVASVVVAMTTIGASSAMALTIDHGSYVDHQAPSGLSIYVLDKSADQDHPYVANAQMFFTPRGGAPTPPGYLTGYHDYGHRCNARFGWDIGKTRIPVVNNGFSVTRRDGLMKSHRLMIHLTGHFSAWTGNGVNGTRLVGTFQVGSCAKRSYKLLDIPQQA